MTPTSRLLLLLLIPLLVVTVTFLPKARAQHSYSTPWDLLLSHANNISINNDRHIRRVDADRYLLWHLYRTSTSLNSERLLTVVKELNEEISQWKYINSRINMIGLILFGPEKYRSILSTVRDPKQGLANDLQCFASTWRMFYEHCGCLREHCYEHLTAFGNMCDYATDKAAIKDALAFACGMDRINPLSNLLQPVVNLKNRPSILHVTPAPVRGSSEYCERVAVEGVSRMKLGSFFKTYRVFLKPSRPTLKVAQVCVHRDASMGLCECEKNGWRFLENWKWSFAMSPYDQLYVDVKLSSGISGSVSVNLEEVSQEWRYMLLAVGFSLLFLAPIASKCLPSYCSSFTRILVVRAIAVTCIFQASFDTLYAMISVVTCLALYLKIMSIYRPVFSR